VLAFSGFQYSGIAKSMEFTAKPGVYFWSNGYAWGTCKVHTDQVELQVLHGSLALDKFQLSDGRESNLKTTLTLNENEKRTIVL